MSSDAKDRKVAIVVADGFEQVELTTPRAALEKAGFQTEIISPGSEGTVQGYHHQEKGDAFPIEVTLAKAQPESYAALLLPGGVHNPDALRQNPQVLDFVRHFFSTGKPVAAICHGPWTLIDAEVVSGRRLTSYASIKTDLKNAGAEWVDESVVVDRGLVTSRSPHDLPAFCRKMIEEFQKEPSEGAQDAALFTKLWDLIKHIKVAMLTTRQPDGTLHSCPMMTQGKRFDRNLWFFTAASSYKCQEVEKDSVVNVSYADPGGNRYVSVSGRARLVQDRAKLQELWTPLVKAWFPKGLDDPELGLLQVTVDRAEYWDAPAGGAVTLFALAKSLLTRRPYQGEMTAHERLELEPARSGAATSEATPKASSDKERSAPDTKDSAAAAPATDSAPPDDQADAGASAAGTDSEPAPAPSKPAQRPPAKSTRPANKRTRK